MPIRLGKQIDARARLHGYFGTLVENTMVQQSVLQEPYRHCRLKGAPHAYHYSANAQMAAPLGEVRPVGARPESSSRRREFPCGNGKWRSTMTRHKLLVAAALISTISTTSALAQDPAAFQSQFPYRDVLNGGALTPAGRILELPGGAASLYEANKAGAGVGSASPSPRAPRHHGRLPRP